jgi:lysophospholipase L1-like esterase
VIRAVVARYNAAIARVVTAEGAHLVDLHRAASALSSARLTAADGFHPSTEGHRAVAAAFAATLAATPPRTPTPTTSLPSSGTGA